MVVMMVVVTVVMIVRVRVVPMGRVIVLVVVLVPVRRHAFRRRAGWAGSAPAFAMLIPGMEGV
jgi:hypothetical protein